MNKRKILILNGQYIPGFKGGGPIQSCVNMVENLSDKFEFYILTSDRDFKSDIPYEDVSVNAWNKVGSANVYYMSPERQTIKGFNELINSVDYDIMYLNGFFSPIFTIKPLILRRLNKLKNKSIILTPRGDFTGGCENKKIKKYSYIYLCKIIGLYDGLIWHATSNIEKMDIKKKFKKAKIYTIPNLSSKFINKGIANKKNSGELKLVFISRIFPKKNLKFALEVLTRINRGNIIFDIYGPMEDKIYWNECTEIISKMPDNIKVSYKGELDHSKIGATFEQYHSFIFPTLGENYGHVIVESMMNNCPVILSKGVTPWDDYESIEGTVAKLNDLDAFVDICNKLIDMDQYSYVKYVKKTSEYIEKKLNNSNDINGYIDMLNKEIE